MPSAPAAASFFSAIARSMATRWAMTSTASACVFAHRAIWLSLLPMRATWRVSPRSTATARAVQVRVRAMACRSRSDGDTPAAAAFACQAACSEGNTRARTTAVRRSAIGAPPRRTRGGTPRPQPETLRDPFCPCDLLRTGR